MGLQLPEGRSGTGRIRRLGVLAAMGTGVLALAGCSAESRGEWERGAMPEPASAQGEYILSLWQGAWIAALLTGIVVWGLIFYACWAFRRRSADDLPVQTRYNLPLEIFYTIAPVIMVIVFFNHTVKTQNVVLDKVDEPDNVVEVVGQQWSWTFNHGVGEPDYSALEDRFDDQFAYDRYVHEGGTGGKIPTLVLPVDQTTRFHLWSPDVIHSFGIPGFLMKLDVIPGRVNHLDLHPTEIGEFRGKCYELCGTAHSRMLFNVDVRSAEDYERYVADLESAGQVSDQPLLGSSEAYTQPGLETEEGDHE